MQEISIGRLHGRYVVYWWGEDGRRSRFRLEATTRQEAKSEGLRVWEAHKALKGYELTFQDLKEVYHKHLGDRIMARQVEGIWKYMGPALGSFRANQINDETMKEFLEERQKKAIQRRGRPLSDGTLLRDVVIAQTILNYGTKKNLIDFGVHLTKPVKPAPKEIWFDRSEIRRLLDEVESVPHLYTATLLMLATAGRVEAVLELTWDRVDFEDDWIDLRIDPKKPAKGRAKIPMNRGLRNHLLKVKETSDSEFVVSYRGESIGSIYKAFKAHCRSAGLPDGSPHVLRHSAAVHMVAAGCEMHRVSQYLGHKSVSTTETIYARFKPEHLRKEAAAVDFVDDEQMN
ncbi:MAG TPA: site-specific integrase, partial [Amaricoccus sp.]|nr:site-specific integrase [Amaricoccus sp.]